MVRAQLYDPEAGRQAKAQDIVQETFIRLIRHLKQRRHAGACSLLALSRRSEYVLGLLEKRILQV